MKNQVSASKEYIILTKDNEFVRFSDESLVVYGDNDELEEDLTEGEIAVVYDPAIHK